MCPFLEGCVVRKLFRVVGAVLVALVLAAIAAYAWASITTNRLSAEVYATHSVDFPIPFPLDSEEVSRLGLTAEAARQLAEERAVERGGHLVRARYTCTACHGTTFGGGVMVDAFPIGRLLAPNVTRGAGSSVLQYGPKDWDRIGRHGVLPDGRSAVMPSEDFQLMSDQELSDIVSYLRTLPPVDNTVPAPSFGPLGKILVATGQMHFSAHLIDKHDAPHLVRPPAASASAEFGKHLAGVCTGCHGPDFSGGPIPGGDPSWPPARNLTPDATGLWTYEQFVAPYGQSMTDVERQALWAYLQSVPAVRSTVPQN